MLTIRDFMSTDHRHCDDLFAAVEAALEHAQADRLPAAQAAFAAFATAIDAHFTAEETLLFPAFEDASGMRFGPTAVMRDEHEQMREQIRLAGDALAAASADDYAGEAETLLILMQQHNVKEEGILYPMCDRQLAAGAEQLLGQIAGCIGGKE